MKSNAPEYLMSQADGPAVELCNAQGQGGFVLVCEHASNAIPAALNGLGLQQQDRQSHAAWDIGARDVALALSKGLDAPLVAARVSRLVYDCNRPPEAESAMPAKSELIKVPGNVALTAAEKAQRVAEVYLPFHAMLADVIATRTPPPVFMTIHSFTPVYFGNRRATELGFLHDSDDRFAKAMLRAAMQRGRYRAELNAPYAASDGVTHTLQKHALPQALPNVMIEIRNDLIDRPETAAVMAAELCEIVALAVAK